MAPAEAQEEVVLAAGPAAMVAPARVSLKVCSEGSATKRTETMSLVFQGGVHGNTLSKFESKSCKFESKSFKFESKSFESKSFR